MGPWLFILGQFLGTNYALLQFAELMQQVTAIPETGLMNTFSRGGNGLGKHRPLESDLNPGFQLSSGAPSTTAGLSSGRGVQNLFLVRNTTNS